MAENNDITNFRAADIEKYWTGRLSASEMHAMEKAAMDDPFLADSLEGYNNTTTATADLNELKERLDKRLTALVPVVSIKQKRYPWFRVAAAIIILAGIGLLVQQLLFNTEKQNAVANLERKQEEKAVEPIINKEQSKPDSNNQVLFINPGVQANYTISQSDSSSPKTNQKFSNSLSATISNGDVKQDTLNATFNLELANDKKAEAEKIELPGTNAVTKTDADGLKDQLGERAFSKSPTDSLKSQNLYKAKASVAQQRTFANVESAGAISNYGLGFTNKYNYRVVDAQNNPVPFANVMNIEDKVGTYTDIRGNFNLVSSDSILNVQIKSLGYLSNNYELVPSAQFKSLTLKEDYYAKMQILDSNRQLVSNVTRKDTAELEEPEVGWGNFNTYVANNIHIPKNIRKKSTLSNVELSFEIDENGSPINIKVTKSSQCKECDEEAKRLLKEGPKWKKKGRRSKTTISIAVDQK